MDDTAVLPDDRPALEPDEIEYIFSRERRSFFAQFARPWEEPDEEEGFQEVPQPIVVGIEALRRNYTRIGDEIEIQSFSPRTVEARVQSFIVVGAFQTGVFEQDQGWMFIPIEAAVQFLDLFDEEALGERVSGVSIRLDDYRHANEVRDEIKATIVPNLPETNVFVETWEDKRRNLLRAVDIEKRIISVMMMLIILFAGVMIFLILTLMVIEKTRDLGVLRSLGATRAGVISLFLRQGMTLTFLGIVLGSIAGVLLVQNINPLHDWVYKTTGLRLFPPDVYYLSRIPTKLRATDWGIVLIPAVFFGFLGSMIPAMWAARRDPIKALHHD